MITKRQYSEYLISTPSNYTCSNLAQHLEGMSHDAVSDYLQRDTLPASHLWDWVAALLQDSKAAYLIRNDSVQNKQHSQKIERAKKQYCGAEQVWCGV